MLIFRKPVAGLSARSLSAFAERARKAAGVRGEVNVLISGDAELRRLNREFRRKDKATDVLSFPAMLSDQGGDIAISAQMAARAARRLGHPLTEEVKILILHGMLHLAGYDHETDGGEMARKEDRLRRRLGLPDSLTGRVAPSRKR